MYSFLDGERGRVLIQVEGRARERRLSFPGSRAKDGKRHLRDGNLHEARKFARE